MCAVMIWKKGHSSSRYTTQTSTWHSVPKCRGCPRIRFSAQLSVAVRSAGRGIPTSLPLARGEGEGDFHGFVGSSRPTPPPLATISTNQPDMLIFRAAALQLRRCQRLPAPGACLLRRIRH